MTVNEKLQVGQCRLDLWLWAARFYKTRSLAALNIKKGLISISGKTTTKPASILNVGSHLVIDLNSVRTTILVEKIAIKRGSYEKAKLLYKIISKESDKAEMFFKVRARYKRDKKVRRNLKAFKEKLHFLSDN